MMLNTIFVTFMYGFGLPLLFPVAVLAMAILYFVEKTMLYYAYQQPPMYDDRLHTVVMRISQFAPIFYLAFAYWMCSSNQLLSNNFLYPIKDTAQTQLTGHTYSQIFTSKGWEAPAWPLLVMNFLFAMVYFFEPVVAFLYAKIFPKYVVSEIESEEDVDNYWASLDHDQRNWSICEETNSRKLQNGLKMLTDDQFNRLKTVENREACNFIGAHSYDILANPLYLDDFQYISSSVENRSYYIIDDDKDDSNDMAQSDVVRIALNLAYLPENEISDVRLDKDGYVFYSGIRMKNKEADSQTV